MRITLSLNDDVAKLLRSELRRSDTSLKAAVNHFLRLGLKASRRREQKPFVVHPRAIGLPAGLSYDNVEDLIEALEGWQQLFVFFTASGPRLQDGVSLVPSGDSACALRAVAHRDDPRRAGAVGREAPWEAILKLCF